VFGSLGDLRDSHLNPAFYSFLLFGRSARANWALPTSYEKQPSALPGREAEIELHTWAGLTSPGKPPARLASGLKRTGVTRPSPHFPLETLSIESTTVPPSNLDSRPRRRFPDVVLRCRLPDSSLRRRLPVAGLRRHTMDELRLRDAMDMGQRRHGH
jgi:hypothetical protein